MLSLKKRGRQAAALAGAVTIAGSFAFLSPAGASVSKAKNNFIIGSGSATTYSVMTQLGDLFNSLPGCNLIAPSGSTQPLDFTCQAPLAGQTGAAYGENANNDVAVSEPQLGSSNGINQLQNQGPGGTTKTVASALTNYARSSRAASTPANGGTDQPGMNFVAFAKDGVSWFHFTQVLGSPTASAKITSLSQTQLEEIWSGSPLATYWCQVAPTPCKTGSGPKIEVYAAQAGSGTLSTWASFLGTSSSALDSTVASKWGINHVILENEDNSVISTSVTTKNDTTYVGNAIYFFSYGKYQVTCRSVCGGGTVPGTNAQHPTTTALGEVNGVAPSKTTILNGLFPVPRFLYNVYANAPKTGQNPDLTPATQATLNFVSEDGFLCKPQTVAKAPVLDPNTGVAVRTEINTIIANNGFFSLPLQAGEGIVPNPAKITTAPYKSWDPAIGAGGQYSGYCVVSTTDG